MKPRRPLGIIRPLAPILGRGRRRWRGGPLVPMIWRRRLRARPAPQRPTARPQPVTQVNHFHLTFIRPERSTATRRLPPARIGHPGLPLVRSGRLDARPLPLAPIHHFNLTLVWPERTAARIAPLSRLERAAPHNLGGGRGERLGSREASRLVTLIEHLRLRPPAAADGGKPCDGLAIARSAGAEGPGPGGWPAQGRERTKRAFLPRAEARRMRGIAAAGAEREDRAAANGAARRFMPQAEPMRRIAARAAGQGGENAAFDEARAAPLFCRPANISAMRAGAPASPGETVPGAENAAAAGRGGTHGAAPRAAMRFGFLVWKSEAAHAPGSGAAPVVSSASALPPRVAADAVRAAAPAPHPENGAAPARSGQRARAGDGRATKLWKQSVGAPAADKATALPSQSPEVAQARSAVRGAPYAVPAARDGVIAARRSPRRAALTWRGEGRGMDGSAAAPSYPRAHPKRAAELVWRRSAPGSAPDQSGIFGGATIAGARPGEVQGRADRPATASAPAPAAPAPSVLQPMEINRLVDEVVRRLDRIGRDERMRRGI